MQRSTRVHSDLEKSAELFSGVRKGQWLSMCRAILMLEMMQEVSCGWSRFPKRNLPGC